MVLRIPFCFGEMTARQGRYERGPSVGVAARDFSAAYDRDRARAEENWRAPWRDPKDSCPDSACEPAGEKPAIVLPQLAAARRITLLG